MPGATWCANGNPSDWGFEGGQIKSSIGPFLERRASERKAYVSHKTFPSKHDKSVRAQSIRGRMAMEGLYVPTQAPWFPDFFIEILAFPAGKHDDQVDALSLIGQMLSRITRGHVPQPAPKIQVLCPPPGDDRYEGVTPRRAVRGNRDSPPAPPRTDIAMPVLPNARHERSAQALSQGMTQEKAYIAAGYKPNRHNAARLRRTQTKHIRNALPS